MHIDPPVATFDPVAPFELAAGRLTLTATSDAPVDVHGNVRYIWSPSPRLTFAGTSPTGWPPMLEATEITVPTMNLKGRAWLANQRRTSTEMQVDGLINDAAHIGAADPPVAELRFVLVNFAETPRLVSTFDGWTFEAAPVDNLGDLIRTANAERGHIGTHLCRLSRTDGSPFLPSRSESARDVIYWGLSFARAQHVGVELVTGFDGYGLPVWRDWRESNVDRSTPRLAWFHPRDRAALPELLGQLADRWPDLGGALPTALSFYLESSTSATPETSIVIGCAGLDLVGWLTLVDRGPRLSTKAFDDLWQSDRIRLVLNAAGVSNDIPASLPNLASHATANKWIDGPHAVTELRNAIVHPKKWAKAGSAPVAASVEAKRLLLWYFDLTLLRLCGYGGRYVPHTASFPAGLVAQPRPVPWSHQ